MLHLTGEFSIQGQAFREGMELGADAVREGTGLDVQLILEDTQYSAVKSVTAAKKLLSSDRVDAAAISTAVEAKAAGPEFQRSQTPAIVLWDSSPEIEAIGNFVFAIGPWIPGSGEKMARFAAQKLHAKTAAIINTNTEWSAAVSNSFSDNFERFGGEIVSKANENPSETDFRTTLAKAKRHTPQVFYVPVDANLIAFFHQAKQMGLDVPLLTSDIITEDNLQEAADAFEGIYQSMPQVGGTPVADEMLGRYKKRYGKECTQLLFVAWGYDAVRLIADAYVRAGKISGKTLQEQLLATKNFPGASNTITMNAKGTASATLGVFQVKQGKFVLVP